MDLSSWSEPGAGHREIPVSDSGVIRCLAASAACFAEARQEEGWIGAAAYCSDPDEAQESLVVEAGC
jgi:hypothetical protein